MTDKYNKKSKIDKEKGGIAWMNSHAVSPFLCIKVADSEGVML